MADYPRSALDIAWEKAQAMPASAPVAPVENPPRPPSCDDCRFAVMQDYGYSNYTVEGTEFFCAIKKHPADGFDRWYGDDKRLAFAAGCDMFREGEPIGLDVDGDWRDDEYSDLTAEQKVIVGLWDGEPRTPPKPLGGR